MAQRGKVAIGATRGGRGRLPASIQSMGDYYRSGRSSAMNPGGVVRNQQGQALNRAKS